jgi:hypothetical protein
LTDFVPKLVTEMDIRNFFSPPLDYNDITSAEILLKIEVVEDYIKAIYGFTSPIDARIPALLLVASKIAENPSLSKKYHKIDSEKLGDYSYTLSKAVGSNSTYKDISTSWEALDIRMLESRYTSDSKWTFLKVND